MSQGRRERRLQARQMKAATKSAAPSSQGRCGRLLVNLLAFLGGSAAAFAIAWFACKDLVPRPTQQISVVHSGLTLGHLLEMTPEQLSGIDIAEVNLLCAQDLPGAENVDMRTALATLDQWADHVGMETRRNWHRFKENPEEYHNSEAEFRMGMLITVLQQDYGIGYNPDLIPFSQPNQHGPEVDKAFQSNPGNMFLTEILLHRTGTCASLPVLYVAIGRRLGYPVKLSNAKDHLFVRWDRGNGMPYIDIEGSSRGFLIRTDDDFKKWPDSITEQEIKSGEYLKSLTPSEELSVFVGTRGCALLYHQKPEEALVAFAHAIRLWPQNHEWHPLLAFAASRVAPEEIRSTEGLADPMLLQNPRHVDPIQELQMLNQLNGR